MMRFGLCAGAENLEMAERLGFDYLECAVTAIEAMSDADFSAFEAKVKKSAVKVERCNVLFPGTIRLVGSEADHTKLRSYLEKAFSRVKALGGTAVVFGSGQSRAFPENIPFAECFRELVDVTRIIGDIAAKYGIIAAVEPLNREETNCINSVAEGAMLAAVVNRSSVGLLADLFHILKENEPLQNIVTAGKLNHTHIALLEGRAYPTIFNRDVEEFFKALKKIGYSGTMSIEGKTENMEKDAAAALKILRSAAA